MALIFCLVSFIYSQNLPGWFYSPPNHQDRFYGVGISYKYSDHQEAFNDARDESINYIAYQIQLSIISGLASVSSGSKVLTKNYTKVDIDPLLVEKIRKNIAVLDSIIQNNQATMLIAINKDLTKAEKIYYKPISINTKKLVHKTAPKWITEPPKAAGYRYGVGYGSHYKNAKDSWNDSMQEAFLDIAQQKSIKIKSLHLISQQRYTQDIKWLEQNTNTTLKQSRVIERWYDKRTNIYYTLVKKKI